jgi:Fic family protein
MCDYVNQNWKTKKPIHLAAYVMWRLNWIHPFFGGNGRTARAFSYLVLCIGLQFAPPANDKTIPHLIEENREPYTKALRKADRAWAEGRLDVSDMGNLLSDLLATQLVFLHEAATGISHL